MSDFPYTSKQFHGTYTSDQIGKVYVRVLQCGGESRLRPLSVKYLGIDVVKFPDGSWMSVVRNSKSQDYKVKSSGPPLEVEIKPESIPWNLRSKT